MTYEITEADIIEMNKFLDTVVNEDTEHTHKHLMKEYSKDGSPKFSHYMVDKEDYLTKVTPKQFAKSSLPDKTSDKTKEDHLVYLRAKIPQFNRKVEHNSWVKKHNPSYDEELKKLTECIDEPYHEVHQPIEPVTESFKIEELSYTKASPITASLAEAIASVMESKEGIKMHSGKVDYHEDKADDHESGYMNTEGPTGDWHKQKALEHLYAADKHREAIRKLQISPDGNKTHKETYDKAARIANSASDNANKQ